MHYITLDLEWNQAYAQKALAVQKRLSLRLRGEVIQIGAVKLDKNLNVCGSYQIIVKPKHYKKLHKHVSTLTGITQDQIDLGAPLPEAAERFRKWCGKDFAILTWGPDDIPMLKDNLRVHELDGAWLESVYDLQLIYAKQINGDRKQRSLEAAMEHLEIPQTLPAHDALNDAYFTALVAQKLDVAGGVAHYNDDSTQYLEDFVIGDADAGDDGYVTIGELLDDEIVTSPVCPICKSKMSLKLKPLHSKGQRYTYFYNCRRDGDMFLTLKLHRNFNETWRARRTVERVDEERIVELRRAIDISNAKRKVKRKRSQYKRKNVQQAQKIPATNSENI